MVVLFGLNVLSGVAVAMKSDSGSSVSVDVCPFDGLPCAYVSSCDDVIYVALGEFDEVVCSRAVVKAKRSGAERSDIDKV
jgi:hypothetical protein